MCHYLAHSHEMYPHPRAPDPEIPDHCLPRHAAEDDFDKEAVTGTLNQFDHQKV